MECISFLYHLWMFFFYININVKLVQSFAYRSRVPWGLTLSTTSLCEPKVTSVHKGMQLKKCFSLWNVVSGRKVKAVHSENGYICYPDLFLVWYTWCGILSQGCMLWPSESVVPPLPGYFSYQHGGSTHSLVVFIPTWRLNTFPGCFHTNMAAVHIPSLTFNNGCRTLVIDLHIWIVSELSWSYVRSCCMIVCPH